MQRRRFLNIQKKRENEQEMILYFTLAEQRETLRKGQTIKALDVEARELYKYECSGAVYEG